MGFSRQEYWNSLPFPSPVDHVLSGIYWRYTGVETSLLNIVQWFHFKDEKIRMYMVKWLTFLWVADFPGLAKVTTSLKKRKKEESEVAQSCLTLCDPMDCSLPGFCVHCIFQARVLEWVAISFSRGSSWPRDQTPGLLHCRQTLYPLSHQGSPCNLFKVLANNLKTQHQSQTPPPLVTPLYFQMGFENESWTWREVC